MTRAQASAYARNVNLKGADVPGMRIGSQGREAQAPSPAGRELARCAGSVSVASRILDSSSPTFLRYKNGQSEQIQSEVEVMPSEALAVAQNAVERRPSASACFGHFIFGTLVKLDTTRLRYGPVTFSSLPPTLEGGASFGVEFTATILGAPGQTSASPPRFYVDVLGFLSGSTEVDLTCVGFPNPVPLETEQRLVSQLYVRAVTGGHSPPISPETTHQTTTPV